MAFFQSNRRATGLGLFIAGLLVSSAAAQSSVAITEPAAPLLPQRFGQWKQTTSAAQAPSFSLAGVSRQALAECGSKRTEHAEYTHNGHDLYMEAIEFDDRTGATSAYTLFDKPGMKPSNDLGTAESVGDSPDTRGAVLFTKGDSIVLANFGDAVTPADIASLKPLVAGLPKISGPKGVAPLLPNIIPTTGLVQGSVRYALGPLSYVAEDGVLPADHLGWSGDLEAVTASYDDPRGQETLTLLMYPTPTIAENYAKAIGSDVKALQASGKTAVMHREGLLLMVASGSFSQAAASQMLSTVHLRQMTFNQDVQPAFHVVARQTFSLLKNIAILSGILGAAAVLLGLFLGFGRAAVRVMRGKPAALEPEFLSLHLSPQSKPAQFYPARPEDNR